MKRLSLNLFFTIVLFSLAAACQANSPQKQDVSDASTINSVQIAANSTSGNFLAVDHPTTGQAQIIEVDGAFYLELSNNFKSDRGPDLKVILHNDDAVKGKVQPGEYLNLGALTSFKGAQRYLIPMDVDLSQYKSVAIWCEQYNVTFGYAPLIEDVKN